MIRLLPVLLLGCARPGVESLLDEAQGRPPPSSVAELAWMAGHWVSPDGQWTETWVDVGDALIGVGFAFGQWEALRIDDVDGVAYTAWPQGQRGVRFPAIASDAGSVTFHNPEHDSPQVIRYTREGDALRAVVAGPGMLLRPRWERRPLPEAPELERADRALVSAESGPETRRVARASGVSPDGQLGFTIGETWQEGEGEGVETTYATLWQQQPDGSWQPLMELPE